MNTIRPRRTVISQPAGRRHKPDYWLFVLTALLLTIGLVVVYSISPGLAASQHISQNYFILKQLIDVMLGFGAFFLAAYIPISRWRKLAVPLIIAALVGCFIVMVTPIDAVYQAHRWIRFGGFSFQVAELIKISLIVWLASFLTKNWQAGSLSNSKKTLYPLLALLALVAFLVIKLQSDFGSGGVMVVIMLMMAYNAGVPLKRIGLIAAGVALVLTLAIASTSYRRDRLATFLHPGSDCKGSGYQVCQSFISIGSGGLFGQGLGYGVQAYGYQPEASNDSIFAIMGEKLGFIGTSLILFIYLGFFARIKRVIERTADQFSRLMVVGILAWLSTQAFINIGAMIGLLPLKGITLPLISQGGTSLIFITAALGIVFQVSRYTNYSATEPENSFKPPIENSLGGRRLGRSYNATLTARPRTQGQG